MYALQFIQIQDQIQPTPLGDPEFAVGNWNCDFNTTGSCPSNCDNKKWKYATASPKTDLKNWKSDTTIRITSGDLQISSIACQIN